MRTFISVFSAVVSAFTPALKGAIEFDGATVSLRGIKYYVPPDPVSQVKIGWGVWNFAKYNSLQFIPISVLSANETSSLESIFGSWRDRDDVWTESFLTGLCPQGNLFVPPFERSSYNIKFILKPPVTTLPSGPYFVSPITGKVYQAYRLYTDENQAFVYGVIPAANGSYRQLSAHTDGVHTSTIGVPSRLYFTPTADKPLAGYRLGVKDIYDVAGLKTGCGNRAYYQTYPAKNTTAPSVQRLVDAGMVVIGKVKTSQFANAEIATGDWVDYHAPYNPRGDGYQDANASSTGSGSAMASYEWLDFALGSDTGGSMRGPAARCGLYGHRPSHGAIPLDGIMPITHVFDTPGIFSRDAILWAKAGKVWYKDFKDYTMYPKKLLFPVDAFESSYTENPPAPGTVDATLNSFLKKLEGFLGIGRTEINLTTMWAETGPPSVSANSFNDLLNTTSRAIGGFDQIRLLVDPFFQDYAAMNGGRTPFISPAPSKLWAYGRTITESYYQEVIVNKTIFQTWIENEVLRGDQSDACSDAILVYPQSLGTTAYRNAYIGPPKIPFGWYFGRLAIYAEVPDFVAPVGERAYHSIITNTTEYLPVSMSFVAAKNCDFMLFNLIADLQKHGILSELSTGSRLFKENYESDGVLID